VLPGKSITTVTGRQHKGEEGMTRYCKRQRGFSLIELLIVVAIIGIIAAIATIHVVQAQQAARGASAVTTLRVVHSCESSSRATYGRYIDLGALGTTGFLKDASVLSGTKSHYAFAVTPEYDPTMGYTATATPVDNPSVWTHYFIDATGVIRSKIGSVATVSSQPLQ
jgi:prepilin-type N-terminal cleavage/methylation domain-containing protein